MSEAITSKPQSPPLERDTRLDSFRGLMLAEIALVHTFCPVGYVCNEFFGRVSVAAGFLFLSGLVAGAVYSRTAQRGIGAIVRRCTQRTLYIHAYHVAAFLVLLSIALVEPRANNYFGLATAGTGHSALQALGYFSVWKYQPRFFDILPMYGVFVLCMPVALLAFQRGYAAAVLAASLGLWTLAQVGLGQAVEDGLTFRFFAGGFNPVAWQLVFFSGLYLGHMHLFRGVQVVRAHWALVALCLPICLAGFTMRWHLLPWPTLFDQGSSLANKRDYGGAFLVNFFAFSYLVYCLSTRVPGWFMWRPLAFLGRHSIQVFSFQIVVVYLARPLLWRAADLGHRVYDALGLLIVLSLFSAAWCHSLWRTFAAVRRGATLTNAL